MTFLRCVSLSKFPWNTWKTSSKKMGGYVSAEWWLSEQGEPWDRYPFSPWHLLGSGRAVPLCTEFSTSIPRGWHFIRCLTNTGPELHPYFVKVYPVCFSENREQRPLKKHQIPGKYLHEIISVGTTRTWQSKSSAWNSVKWGQRREKKPEIWWGRLQRNDFMYVSHKLCGVMAQAWEFHCMTLRIQSLVWSTINIYKIKQLFTWHLYHVKLISGDPVIILNEITLVIKVKKDFYCITHACNLDATA